MTAQLKRAYNAEENHDLLRPLGEGKVIKLVIAQPPDAPIKYGEYQLRSVGGGQVAICGREIKGDVWYIIEGPWFGLLN